MGVTKYRKRPVVVTAMRMPTESNLAAVNEIVEWMEPGLTTVPWDEEGPLPEGPVADWGVNYLYIDTLEGEMLASLGDYVIRGAAGEFYPCKPEVFDMTYEEVAAA